MIRTIESDFEYQISEVFSSLVDDYKTDQECRKENSEEIQTFSDWLWANRDLLGQEFYDRIDQWCGIDESTQEYNFRG